MRPTRMFYFINGLLQIVDGITYIFCSPFRRAGTYFSLTHSIHNTQKQLKERIEARRKRKNEKISSDYS